MVWAWHHLLCVVPRTVGPSAPAAKKPPKMENVGSKWFIENFDGNEELQVTDTSPKTAVLFVKNTKSLLQVIQLASFLSVETEGEREGGGERERGDELKKTENYSQKIALWPIM